MTAYEKVALNIGSLGRYFVIYKRGRVEWRNKNRYSRYCLDHFDNRRGMGTEE